MQRMSDLLDYGFSFLAHWKLTINGIELDRDAPDHLGIYVFILDSKPVYFGMTTKIMRHRMSDVERGHKAQLTHCRLKALIIEGLELGSKVSVLFALDIGDKAEHIEITRKSLKQRLVTRFHPIWNLQGLS